jgi:hypothetical protein
MWIDINLWCYEGFGGGLLIIKDEGDFLVIKIAPG